MLRLTLTPHGYFRVGLYCPRIKGQKKHHVHRLVAACFIGPIGEGLQVNHLDGDKKNNRAENLEICSASRNISHGHSLGLFPKSRPVPYRRLKEVEILQIRDKYKNGMKQSELAREYGCSPITVHYVVKNKSHTLL